MAQIRASTVQQEREVVHATLQHAASFPCLVEEWYDREEPKPKPKEKFIFVNTKKRKPRSIVWSGVRPRANSVV